MKLFSAIYAWCLKMARHPKAFWFLCADSYMESFFWPIPPEVFLIPMCLATPGRAMRLAFYTTLTSVAGAVCGYYLGYFLYEAYISSLIDYVGYRPQMDTVREWLAVKYGVLTVFIGAFTPIPYKVIAITCGAVAAESVMNTGSAGMLNIPMFVITSFVGRGLRYVLIAGLLKWGGARMERVIARYIDLLGWLTVLLCAAYIAYEVMSS